MKSLVFVQQPNNVNKNTEIKFIGQSIFKHIVDLVIPILLCYFDSQI